MDTEPTTTVKRGRFLPAAGVVVGLVLLVTVPALFTRDLWNPDEPRYMEVAREMTVTGEYVLPHLNGELYSEKPPLFFWLAGVLWRAGFGYNAGRILTAVAVCGTLLLLYALCRAHLGSSVALLAAGASLTCMLLLWFAQIGVLDPLLTLFVTAAIVLGYTALHASSTRMALCWLGCYAAMGLGTLTKGPVGFLVPGLVLLSYGVLDRSRVRAGGFMHAAGFAVFAAVVLGWLLPAIVAGGPDYTRTILLTQNVGRAVGSWSHRNPFHYYLVRGPLCFLPWTPLLPFAVVAAFRRRREEGGLVLLAVVWLVVPFVFFSLMSGKRFNYVVPTVPAVGILCAWYAVRMPASLGTGRLDRWLFAAVFGSVGLLALATMAGALAAPAIVRRIYTEGTLADEVASLLIPGRLAATAAMLVLCAALAAAGALRLLKRPAVRAWAVVAAVLLYALPLELFLMPAVNVAKSARHFGQTINSHAAADQVVYLYGDEFSGVYNLWTGRVKMPELTTPTQLRARLADAQAFVVSDLKRLRTVLSPEELAHHALARERVGHRVMLLLRGAGQTEGHSESLRNGDLMVEDPD